MPFLVFDKSFSVELQCCKHFGISLTEWVSSLLSYLSYMGFFALARYAVGCLFLKNLSQQRKKAVAKFA